MLAGGASVEVYSENEMHVQPLHSAAAGRHHEVCRLLIAAGADVNVRQRGGYTPIHAAAQNGDVELVELLLSAGADAGAPRDSGETPAETAEAAESRRYRAALREVAAER